MNRPPNRPRQNSMVQTSTSIRRVKKPAVLKANADSTTRIGPRQCGLLPCVMAKTLALAY